MKKKPLFKLSDAQACQHIDEFIGECDADTVARLLGDFFGGECICKLKKVKHTRYTEFINVYEFKPNEFYMGAFGEIETD